MRTGLAAKILSPYKRLFYLNPGLVLTAVMIPWTAGFFSGIPLLLPFLTAVPAGLILILHLKNKEYAKCVIDMCLYVIWLTIIGICIMYFFPSQASKVILNGQEYWAEMQPWLCGAHVKENIPSQFIPEHLKHMVIVAIASLASAGMIGITFGTILMNYMNYYVVNLMINGANPVLLAFIGWHPWSVLRVVSFIVLGIACAAPLTNRIFRNGSKDYRKIGLLVLISILLELADILLKIFINESWRSLITSNLDPSFFVIVN